MAVLRYVLTDCDGDAISKLSQTNLPTTYALTDTSVIRYIGSRPQSPGESYANATLLPKDN